MSASLASKLKNEIFSRYSLVPSDHWLNQFLATNNNPSHPIAALTSTAHFRLLSTDFTASLSVERGQCFPGAVADVNVKEVTLTVDVPVQVLNIIDTSTSKWSQVEAIERVERGEEIRGREVIRNVPNANDGDNTTSGHETQNTTARLAPATSNGSESSRKGSTGPHKLLLQDAAGTKAWAFEMARIDRITIINMNPSLPETGGAMIYGSAEGMQIGCKMLLKRGTKVRRTLLMLTPTNCLVIGGKIEVWDRKWREGRKERMTRELELEDND